MAIIDRYAGFVLDLDSAPWRAGDTGRDAAALLKKLDRAGRPVAFVTNDSSRTRHQIAQEFERSRASIDPERILTSATAAAQLVSRSGAGATFAVGGAGLVSALVHAHVKLVEDPREAEVVVLGWDADLTLAQLRDVAVAVEAGARFIGTAPDPVFERGGVRWPGPGAVLALVREATGAAPEIVGKPNPMLFELAGQLLGTDGGVLVVGDGVETDLAAANRLGWDTALVVPEASGHVAMLQADKPPAWVVRDLGGLVNDEPPVVRHALASDLSAIHRLLDEAGLEQERAAARLDTTLVADHPDTGEVVGTISWEVVDNAAHLRGITTQRTERGHGTATLLVVRALMELRRTACEWVYLLTPGAEGLFETLGFYRVTRDRVPDEILATAQFGGPADAATALVRRLR